ncbi:enoyl-CoA hydratase/isomerase family protein [Bradyrhizobium sp. 195]|uniref:enoyl-CoA hydratase/isomerase family protein n=1 Tax=Bradyrhizobium sp. 195 TaxID=2782662 RepID=UPI002000838C|nr:enoyl-CoA hydratase-related protein [Bradyrhizobium sp. 195]UPK29942.1 enoyl-CoA hydratase/isomerase family protein [Bradyrhizobium sp. 195]
MDQLISVQLDETVAVLTLNNPKARNALSRKLILELIAKLEELATDKSCRAIILTGAEGTFSSGGDISGMTADRQVLDSRAWMKTAHRLVKAIVGSEKPVVAAVEGYAFGAGLSLATASDFVVAAANAKFCPAFAKIGLIPDIGLFYTLTQRIGAPRAKRMIMLAEVVEGAQAEKIGIVDRVVPAGQALAEALEIAKQYAAVAPLPLALTKTVFARGCVSLEDALAAEVDYQPMLFLSEDHRDAAKAFLEKRKPTFRGR